MAGAMMARVTVDLAVMVGAMVDRATAALRVADLVDRAIVVPMVAALVVSGADPMVLPARGLDPVGLVVDRMVVVLTVAAPAVSGADPMVLLAVQGLDLADLVVDLTAVVPVDLTVLAAEMGEVRAEGASSSGWIRSTASSMKFCGRLSP